MRRALTWITALVLVLAIGVMAGCEQRALESGVVTDKRYTPPSPYIVMTPMYSGDTVTYLPITHFFPAAWAVKVCSNDQSEWWAVSADQYARIEVGAHIESADFR